MHTPGQNRDPAQLPARGERVARREAYADGLEVGAGGDEGGHADGRQVGAGADVHAAGALDVGQELLQRRVRYLPRERGYGSGERTAREGANGTEEPESCRVPSETAVAVLTGVQVLYSEK